MEPLGPDMTSIEVPEIYRDALKQWQSGNFPDRIELGGVRRTDASALALLLDWQARARSAGRSLSFDNPPESLLMLAQLSQASQLLGWPVREE